MKYTVSAITASALIFLISMQACKKKSKDDSTTPANSYSVTYTLYSDDSLRHVTSIKYNNEDNAVIEDTDPRHGVPSASWKKNLTLSKKPFDASMTTQINNTENISFNYVLTIMVNDTIKAYKNVTAPPMATITTNFDYQIK